MMSDNNSHDFYSKFGVDALKATRKGYNLGNIISFIDSVISDNNKISVTTIYYNAISEIKKGGLNLEKADNSIEN